VVEKENNYEIIMKESKTKEEMWRSICALEYVVTQGYCKNNDLAIIELNILRDRYYRNEKIEELLK
jgi:hypothetical protein